MNTYIVTYLPCPYGLQLKGNLPIGVYGKALSTFAITFIQSGHFDGDLVSKPNIFCNIANPSKLTKEYRHGTKCIFIYHIKTTDACMV